MKDRFGLKAHQTIDNSKIEKNCADFHYHSRISCLYLTLSGMVPTYVGKGFESRAYYKRLEQYLTEQVLMQLVKSHLMRKTGAQIPPIET